MLLLAVDFYTIKNIAGRRLVGLRWWNEVNPHSGDTTMVFESVSKDPNDPTFRPINATDKRFFWLGLYAQPVLWVLLAVSAIVTLKGPIWLSLVGECALKGLSLLQGTDLVYSYRPRPYNHQHCRLFAMRQVRSRVKFCQFSTIVGWASQEPRVGHGLKILLKVAQPLVKATRIKQAACMNISRDTTVALMSFLDKAEHGSRA